MAIPELRLSHDTAPVLWSRPRASNLPVNRRPEANGKAVPGVDGDNRHREIDQVFLGKVLPHAFVGGVRHVPLVH